MWTAGIFLATGLAALQTTYAAAQNFPRYDITNICNTTMHYEDTQRMCAVNERLVRDNLMMRWNGFAPALQHACTIRTAEDKWPSYVTLSSCLIGGNP